MCKCAEEVTDGALDTFSTFLGILSLVFLTSSIAKVSAEIDVSVIWSGLRKIEFCFPGKIHFSSFSPSKSKLVNSMSHFHFDAGSNSQSRFETKFLEEIFRSKSLCLQQALG